MNIDIVLRALGADAVANSLQQIANGANNVNTASNNAAGGAGNLGTNLNNAGSAADAAKAKMEGFRNAGAAIAVAGAAALVLSANLRQAAAEGADAQKKMEDMFAKRGEGGRVEELGDWAGDLSKQAAMVDDDPIKEAAAQLAGFGVNADQVKGIMPGLIGQSRLYNQSLESVASAFGKAFSSGNAGALKKSGVTLDQADIDKLKNMTDPVEKQKALFDMVKKSMDQYALGIREGMSEATIAANLLANEMDSLYGGIGEGAAAVHTSLTNHLLIPLLQIANSSPELQFAAGAILEIGGAAGSTIGSVVAFAGQVGMATVGLQAMGFTGVRAFGAMMWASMKAGAAMVVSFAPVIATVLAIAAAIVLVGLAMRELDKFLNAKEDAELAANIKAGDATDEKRLEISNKYREKKGLPAQTMAQFEGDPNADDTESAPDFASLQKGIDDLKSGKMGAAPTINVSVPASAAAVMETASDDGDEDTEDLGDLKEVKDAKSGKKEAENAAKDAKRAAEKAAKASARKADKDKKEAEKAADKAEDAARDAKGYALDIFKARSDDKFDSEIERLEDLLDAAKEDANLTKVKALTLELAAAKAKKARADREIGIAQTALTNAAKAASMKSISDIEFNADMRRAERESRNAKLSGSGGANDKDKRDAGLRAQKMLRGGGIGGGFGFAALNPSGYSAGTGNEAQSVNMGRIKNSVSQMANGDHKVEFEPIIIPNNNIGSLRGRMGR